MVSRGITYSALAAVLVGVLLLSLAPAAYALTVTIKDRYAPGEELVVSGTATPNSMVTVRVVGPKGLVTVDQIPTDAEGKFSKAVMRFPEQPTGLIPYGTYTVVIVDVATGERVTVKTVYGAFAGIKGVVVDEEGNPLAGATVEAYKEGVKVTSVETGSDGSFLLPVDAGVYTVKVSKPNYRLVEITGVEVGAGETEDIGTVTLVSYDYVISVLSRSVDELRSAVDELNKKMDELRVYIGDLSSRVRDVEGRYEELASAVEELESGLEELSDKVSSLESRVGSLEGTVGTLASKSVVEELSRTVSELKASVDELKSAVEELRSGLEDVKKAGEENAEKISGLESRVKTLEGVTGTISSLQSSINSLQKSIDDFGKKVEDLTKKASEASSQASAIAAQLPVLYAISIIGLVIALVAVFLIYRKISG
ncbi:MAG: hypothetical protein DRO39_06290 [Thermoprotei archaeon]|nr:MAG: hypothetical protein DRO39_06290 [Thermoprotei archaeon]